MIDLKSRLIIEYSTLKSVATIINNSQISMILILFSMAILFEFFSEWNFLRVLKRLVICFFVLGIYETLSKGVIDFSFSYSNIILDNCKKTEFCSHYLTMKRGMTGILSQDSTLWHETVSLFNNFSSFWIYALVSLIFKFAFVFTIQIYSLVYAISSVTYPLICSIGLLPVPGEKAYIGLFQTLLWLFLSPIFLSIIIVLLAGVTEVGIGPKGEVGLEGLLHLMVISVFSLGSLFLTWNICNGSSVAAFGSQVSQMGTMVLGMTGINAASSFGKQSGASIGTLGKMASSSSGKSLKNYVSSNASAGLAKKGLTLTASDIGNTKTSFLKSSLVPKGSSAYDGLSKKEKVFQALDSVINAKENNSSKFGMIKDLKKISNASVATNSASSQPKLSPNLYKDKLRNNSFNHAGSGSMKSNSVGNQVFKNNDSGTQNKSGALNKNEFSKSFINKKNLNKFKSNKVRH